MTSTSRAREAAGLDAQPSEPGRELTQLDQRIARTRAMESAFADAVASGLSPDTLVRDAITALRNLPDLHKVTEASFFGALMTSAQLGLRPNVGPLGHGWVLPFYNNRLNQHEAKWILGYQGMVELGYKSGLVSKITAHTIYANEPHDIEYGSVDSLVHKPILDRDKRGDPIAHYAVVSLSTGERLWNVISDADAQDTMARSQSGSRGQGPWSSDYGTMARKTALRGVWRFMPKTPILALALSTDDVVREDTSKEPELIVVEPDATATPETIVDPNVVDAEIVVDPNDACPICGSTTSQHDEKAHAEAGA